MNTMNSFEKADRSYAGREYLYLFPRPGGTYNAVNYNAVNVNLNSFLSLFDVWGGKRGGLHKISDDGNHTEVWFEVSAEFYRLAMFSDTFRAAIERLGVKIVTEYPFPINHFGNLNTNEAFKVFLGW